MTLVKSDEAVDLGVQQDAGAPAHHEDIVKQDGLAAWSFDVDSTRLTGDDGIVSHDYYVSRRGLHDNSASDEVLEVAALNDATALLVVNAYRLCLFGTATLELAPGNVGCGIGAYVQAG